MLKTRRRFSFLNLDFKKLTISKNTYNSNSILRLTSQTCLELVTFGFWLVHTLTSGGLSQIPLLAAPRKKWRRLLRTLSYLTIKSSSVRTRKRNKTKPFQDLWVSVYCLKNSKYWLTIEGRISQKILASWRNQDFTVPLFGQAPLRKIYISYSYTKNFDHISPILRELGWLSIKDQLLVRDTYYPSIQDC